MRLAAIKTNDVVDVESGIAVSVWVQGCPHRCHGCHNPETWSFTGGKEVDDFKLTKQVAILLTKNNVKRDLAILGGEPLCPENAPHVAILLQTLFYQYQWIWENLKVYLWTGYTLEDLKAKNDYWINWVLRLTDVLIDGPYIEQQRDITLPLRGSTNQRILYKGRDF